MKKPRGGSSNSSKWSTREMVLREQPAVLAVGSVVDTRDRERESGDRRSS
jgi:hypothetical protein